MVGWIDRGRRSYCGSFAHGAIVGMTGFWMLSHFASKLAGPTAELDSYEDQPEENEGAEGVSIGPDEDSTPSVPVRLPVERGLKKPTEGS